MSDEKQETPKKAYRKDSIADRRKQRKTQPTKIFEHPNDPSVQVELELIPRLVQMQHFSDLQNSRVTEVLVHPQTGEVLRNPITGQPEVIFRTKFTIEGATQLLRRSIKSVRGVFNLDDQMVEWNEETMDSIIELFFHEIYDVYGEKGGVEAFANYLARLADDSEAFRSGPGEQSA